MIKLIVACDKNKLIGKGKSLPWHIPEELKFFKEETMNKYLVMGETTFLSLPSSLAGRKIIVLSFDKKDLGYKTINDFQYVVDKFQSNYEDIYIAGGKSIYEQFYKYAQEIYISEIHEEFEGNIYLNLDLKDYKKTVYKEFEEFTVYKYIKRGDKNESKIFKRNDRKS